MSAERNLSPQDYELLSAYIDGELSDAEQQALQGRLSNDPLLQRELDSLQATVNLIHLIPEMTAPRDFTLTLDMVAPKNVVQLHPRRAPRNAYLSLVASVTLMLFGALFMFSEISQESMTASFDRASVQQSVPASEAQPEVALLPTDTPIESDGQAERALSQVAAEDVVLEAEEEAPADESDMSNESGIFLTVEPDSGDSVPPPPSAGGAGDTSSGVFLTVDATDIEPALNMAEASEAEGGDSLDADLAEDAVTANDADTFASDMADETTEQDETLFFDAEVADEPQEFEVESIEESDDAVVEESSVVGGANFSAPEAQTEITTTEEDLADDGVVETVTTGEDSADIEPDTAADKVDPTADTDESVRRDRDDARVPSAPSSEPQTIGALEAGIGLFSIGVLFLIMSFALFRRNRS